MRTYLISMFCGLSATLVVYAPFPVQAAAQLYQPVSGRESIRINRDAEAILESVGLSFNSFKSTADVPPGFDVSLNYLPPSSNPNVRGSSFFFSYDNKTGEYIPLGGTEEYTGGILFDVNRTKLNLPYDQLFVGNLSIRLDENFRVTGVDTATTGLPFITPLRGEGTFDLNTQTSLFENLDVLVAKEFNDFLNAAGSTVDITGLRVATARADRTFAPLNAARVPEPSTALAILMVGATIAVAKRKAVKA